MRLLIVSGDDFGLTKAVCRGILRAHREGIVTSASVLAVAPAFEACAPELSGSGLGVGVHLAAVGEDPPLLPAGRLRSLVGEDGRFSAGWAAFLRRLPRVRASELEEEFAAQIEKARGAGLDIDHLDAHQHLHLLPRVREVVFKLARRFGIRAVRVPRGGSRRMASLGVRILAGRLARRAEKEGLVKPDRCEGFDESGRMTLSLFTRALDRLGRSGAASAEIFLHPGEADDPERHRYAWGYDWAGELAALVDPAARAAVARAGFRLGTYADL